MLVPKESVELDENAGKKWPERGDIVSFAFTNFSRRALPVDPKIYRIRTDLSWEDVIQSHISEPPVSEEGI